MKIIGSRLFVPLLLLATSLSVGTAAAAEKFVDNSGAPRCDNSPAAGTEARPWCTINYAVRQVGPGDVVSVKNGTYRENVLIERTHGGARYITIRNYPGHSPVIRGEGIGSGRNKIQLSSYIKLIGFTITQFQQGLFVDASSQIHLQNIKVHDIGQEGVRIRLNSSFVTLLESEVRGTGKWRYNGEGIYIGTSTSQQPASPPYDNTHDILIKDSLIQSATDECIEVKEGTFNVTIQGNRVEDCLLKADITSPGWGSIELMDHRKFFRGNPNHVVTNNTIRTLKTAIGVHTGATVSGNRISGQTGEYRGISIDNPDTDAYARIVSDNTIELPDSNAIVVTGRPVLDARNNVRPGGSPSQITPRELR